MRASPITSCAVKHAAIGAAVALGARALWTHLSRNRQRLTQKRQMSTYKPGDRAQCPYPTSSAADFKSFDPSKQGVYDLLISAVVPRPIALVSTCDSEGVGNLAPFSYFGAMAHDPPILAFSMVHSRTGKTRDTLQNILETSENGAHGFVVHIVSDWWVEQANFSCGSFPKDVDELKVAGLTTIPSELVVPPRVAEAAVAMECTLDSTKAVINDDGRQTATIVFARVRKFHINKAVLSQDGETVDAGKLCPIARLGGNIYSPGAQGQFERPRPPTDDYLKSSRHHQHED